jgi:hypothetical protein
VQLQDASGKELGRTCPKLKGRHHGTVGYITQDLLHVRVQLQIDAAETAVELLSGRKGVRETGS